MNIIVSGGGTGGHIYPALTIIRAIQRCEPSVRILYVGGKNGLEADIVPREGIDFVAMDLAGFQRNLSLANIGRAWRALRAVTRARGIVQAFQPAVAIGTGGYVAGPILLAASLAGVPTLGGNEPHPCKICDSDCRRHGECTERFSEGKDLCDGQSDPPRGADGNA